MNESTENKPRGLRIILGLIALAVVLVSLYRYDQESIGRSAQYQYGSKSSAVTFLVRFSDARSALLGRPKPGRIVIIAQEKKPSAMPAAEVSGLIPAAAEGLILISADTPPKVQVCKPPLFAKLQEIWTGEVYQELVQEPVAREREKIEAGEPGQPFARFVLKIYPKLLDPAATAFFERHNR